MRCIETMSAYPGSYIPKTQSGAHCGSMTGGQAVALAITVAVVAAGCSMPAPETVEVTDANAPIEPPLTHEAPVKLASDPVLNRPGASYTDMLIRKAQELAEKELGRMSAAELTYRNTVSFQELVGPMFTPGTGNYMKMYRSFNEFTIKDIYRSESFVYPVAVEIEFKYQFLNTQPRSSALPNARALSRADTRFSVVGSYTLTRRYRCDGEGNYTGRLPELPPRPNFYRRGLDQSAEPNSALPNRLPPGGPAAASLLPMASPMNSLPPAPGGTFP